MNETATSSPLTLRIGERSDGDIALKQTGVCLAQDANAQLVQVPVAQGRVCFRGDSTGAWLSVMQGESAHINGRPVRQFAALRAGDSVYVDGHSLNVLGREPAKISAAMVGLVADTAGDARMVLRGMGGPHHGRAINLAAPRIISTATDADVRLQGRDGSEQVFRVQALPTGEALLHCVSGSCMVNGHAVQDALLQPQDQIVFDAHHRFVLEGPAVQVVPASSELEPQPPAQPPAKSPLGRLPWVLLVAALIAGVLSLLLFGL